MKLNCPNSSVAGYAHTRPLVIPREMNNRMLKFVARVCFVIAIVTASACAAQDRKSEAYLPLSVAIVDVSGGRVERLIQMIREFAEAHHFRLVLGAYPKLQRQVTNMELHVGKDSYFYGSNFRDIDKFELIARSHESESVWQPAWNDLIARISSEFGVRVIQKEPGAPQL